MTSVQTNHYFCRYCPAAKICLPMGLSDEELEQLDQIIGKRLVLQKKDDLFRKGNKFHSVFAVRSGSLKTYTTDIEGHEHIVGFHLPGEVLGLDAIERDVYCSHAVALETSSICRIPFDDVTLLALKAPILLKQLFKMLSKEASTEFLNMGHCTVEERFAAFLLNLSNRFKQRGLSETSFTLSMSRSDIANYLRMATETVSRLFAYFQKKKLVHIAHRQVQLLSLSQLKHIARRVLHEDR